MQLPSLKTVLNPDKYLQSQINGWFVFMAGFFTVAGGSAGTVWFFGGCLAVVLAGITQKFTSEDIRPAYPVLLVFFLFWLTIFPSFLMHENAMEGARKLVSNVQLVFFGLLLFGLLRTPSVDYMRVFLWGLRIGLPVSFAIGLGQRFFTQVRPEGLMGNALVFSNISALASMLCLLGLRNENRLGKLVAIVGFTTGIASVVIGLSKSSIIVLVPTGIVLAIYIWKTLRPSAVSVISIALIAVILSGSGLWVIGRYGVLLENRISKPVERLEKYGITPKGILNLPRYHMYKNGWQIFTENPVAGVGLQNTIKVVSERTRQQDNFELRAYGHLHNEYLNQAVGAGIFGVLGLLGMIFAPLFSVAGIRKNKRTTEIRAFTYILSLSWIIMGLSNLLTGQDLMMNAFCWSVLVLLVTKHQIQNDITPDENVKSWAR